MTVKWAFGYVASVILVNWLFLHVHPLIWHGIVLTAGSFVVGLTFILRDYAQRELGHRVLIATFIGTAATALMSPQLALASGAAFLISELADWAVFSRWKGSFRSRVILSSLVGCPVDSALFMLLAGFFSWTGVAIMTVSKCAALLCVLRVKPDGAQSEDA